MTYRIFFEGEPKAKQRHRMGRMHNKLVSYDPQKDEKLKCKWEAATKLRQEGLLKPLEGPIELSIVAYHSYPKSWSKKRVKEVKEAGGWKITKPDLDNIEKFACDVLNGIAYKDDAQVVQIWSEKKYSDTCGVDIEINSKEDLMTQEHAITISQQCSIDQISYLVKKANRLGKMNREIHAIWTHDDEEGSHIFFDVDDLKPRNA